jgi:hypothetical protein
MGNGDETAMEEEEEEEGDAKFGRWMPKGSQFDVGKIIWNMIQRVRGNVTNGPLDDDSAMSVAFTDFINVFGNGTNRPRTDFNQQKESERVVMLCQVSFPM